MSFPTFIQEHWKQRAILPWLDEGKWKYILVQQYKQPTQTVHSSALGKNPTLIRKVHIFDNSGRHWMDSILRFLRIKNVQG